MEARTKVARGGTIHPIADAPIKDGKRFKAMFSPGADDLWEDGEWFPERNAFFRRDGTRLYPEHFSPRPGETIEL